jgi:DNA polymerase-3 subunit gamma/tau
MVARVLVPASDASERGTLARVERLERRVGVEGTDSSPVESSPSSPVESSPSSSVEPVETAGATPVAPVAFQQLADAWPEVLEVVSGRNRNAWAVAFTAKPMGLKDDVLALAFPSQNDVENFKKPQAAEQSVSEQLRQAIVEVLGIRVKFIAKADAAAAKGAAPEPAEPAPEPAEPEPAETSAEPAPVETPVEPPVEPPAETAAGVETGSAPATDAEGWAVAAIPTEEAEPVEPVGARSRPARSEKAPPPPVEPVETAAPETKPSRKPVEKTGGKQRYGEAVVREILGANFIEEQPIAPRVTPSPEA